jgi:hypothetical protein
MFGYKKPAGREPIDHPQLGRLTWEPQLDWWDGKMELRPGLDVTFSVAAAGGDDAPAFASATSIISWVRENDQAARRFAANSDLFETYNSSWNEGPAISPEAFAERMCLDAIIIRDDSTFTLWFNDGDMFLGHAICVEMNSDRSFSFASMQG